jgi:hypothetical protein
LISVGSEVQVLPGPFFLRRGRGKIPRVGLRRRTTTFWRDLRGSAAQRVGGRSGGLCWVRVPILRAERYGGIAQLVEHLLCKQGVIGSNPFASIFALGIAESEKSVGD